MINKTIKKNNKNIKKQKYKLKNKTLKNNNTNTTNNTIQTKKYHKGGSYNTNNIKKENFEVRSLNDFDYERYRISKYINANIDWGSMPGPPPQPNCCIL